MIVLGQVEPGQIGLLVQESFCSNRTDLSRTTMRNLLVTHAKDGKQTVARKSLALWIRYYSRTALEVIRATG